VSKRRQEAHAHPPHPRDALSPAERHALYRRLPWTPLAVSIAVVLGGGFAVLPIRDAVTRADVSDAYLLRPLSYLAIAPLSNALDTLTLLSVRQHIALVLAVLVLFTLWRLVGARRAGSSLRRELIAVASLTGGIVLTYAATAVLPRPMAALVANNVNTLRIDFHSHTSASHDGRPGWSAERNRAWHGAAGYDVAFITDHATVAEAERAVALNPNPARDGVTLLQAIEVTWTGEHAAILGAERMYRGILTENHRDVDVQGLQLASLVRGREPVVVWNHPHDLNRLPVASGPGTMGVRAIEIVNGAPDDMDEIRKQRAEIISLAERANLAFTTGGDNHGWGRTAPGWTLMEVPRWQELNGDALSSQIETAVRVGGIGSTRVVERRVADPGTSTLWLTLTIFAAPARMLTTLSNDERIAWLMWIWLAAAMVWWVRRWRTQRAA
jgi:hypothetical protein